MEQRMHNVPLSDMDLKCFTNSAREDDDLKATAGEVLESLECLLFLMEKEAASPRQVKAYVAEAKKVLLALHLRLDQDALQPNVWLM